MAEPERRQILANIETTLEGIREGETFRTTVRKVERVIRHWDDVPPAERPWLGYMPERETHEYLPGSQIRVTLPFRVLGYVDGKSVDVRDDRVNRLLDDVIVALNADTTRGGCAVSTTLLDSDTDEGDFDSNAGGLIETNWQIIYFRTTGPS